MPNRLSQGQGEVSFTSRIGPNHMTFRIRRMPDNGPFECEEERGAHVFRLPGDMTVPHIHHSLALYHAVLMRGVREGLDLAVERAQAGIRALITDGKRSNRKRPSTMPEPPAAATPMQRAEWRIRSFATTKGISAQTASRAVRELNTHGAEKLAALSFDQLRALGMGTGTADLLQSYFHSGMMSERD